MSSPEKFWQGLATAMERPDIFQDERFASRQGRIDNQEALIAGAAADLPGGRTAPSGAAGWKRRTCRIPPCTPPPKCRRMPQARHLQLFVETEHPVVGTFRTVRSPVSFDGQRPLEVTAPPLLGEHNEELAPRLEAARATTDRRRPQVTHAPYRVWPRWPRLRAGRAAAGRCAQDYPDPPGEAGRALRPRHHHRHHRPRVRRGAWPSRSARPWWSRTSAGAGGNIGSDLVAKAPADGYTILMGTVGTHAINPGLYRRMPYDALKDFAPIGFAGYTPTLLVVAGQLAAQDAEGPAGAGRQGRGGVSFASAGNGTSGHLAGELLKARLGGEMVHVPYKEGGLAHVRRDVRARCTSCSTTRPP